MIQISPNLYILIEYVYRKKKYGTFSSSSMPNTIRPTAKTSYKIVSSSTVHYNTFSETSKGVAFLSAHDFERPFFLFRCYWELQ